MAEGLSYSLVYCISQDKYGFIWVGTEDGLNIYDGIRFKQIFAGSKDEFSIPNNSVTDILIDNDSAWIATHDGLCKMDIRSKKCRNINLGPNLYIRTFFIEEDSTVLWIGTNSGLIKYNTVNNTYREFNTSNSNISHDIVRSIYKDSGNNLWVGTFDQLNLLPANSSVFEVFDIKKDYQPTIQNNLTLSIIPYSEKQDTLLWIGTQTGLVLFNRITHKMRFFRENNSSLSNSVIKTLCKTNKGTVWMGTDFGLGEMNPDFDIQMHFHNPFDNNSLANSIVWDIFEDQSGTIWFGTNNGISLLPKSINRFNFKPMTFSRHENISGYEVRQIIEDSEKNLWVGTQFGVLHCNPSGKIIQTLDTEQSKNKRLTLSGTNSLMEDSKNRLWIGTNGGIILWDPEKDNMKNFSARFNENSSGLRTNYIEGIFETPDGRILINTLEGMHLAIENNNNISFKFIKDLGQNLHLLGNNIYSSQVSRLLKTDLKTYEQTEEISFKNTNNEHIIRSLFMADTTTFWLGTDNGLIKYNQATKTFRLFKIRSNKNYRIINISCDKDGNIWASSYSAILKFSPKTEIFDIYPSGKEIPINRFIENSCLTSKNGDLIFGGHDGFIRFDPDNIIKSDFTPPIRITALLISNQYIKAGTMINGKKILSEDISFTQELILDYKHRYFSLEFSSLYFGIRDGIRYAYELEGADLDWNYLNEPAGKATYSNLRAGDYTFRVKGTNNDGVWNDEETVLNIRVKPPVWAKPPLIATYILFILLIAGSAIYYYFTRLKMLGELKIMRIEKEHANNLSKARQQFFTNIAHELKTPLSLIIGPVEKVLQNDKLDITNRKYMQLIENNARRLLWLNNQLLDFRQIENKSITMNVSEFDIVEFTRNIYWLFTDKAERKNIDYSFESKVIKLTVQMDLRKIETILFNLLSNAFKFTGKNGKILVSIDTPKRNSTENSENKICITVKDTGIGISEEDQKQIFNRFFQAEEALKMERGSGIGLTLVNEYVKIHGGEIELQSQKEKGTEFNIILPLKKYYPEKETKEIDNEPPGTVLKPERVKSDIEDSPINYSSGNPVILIVEDDKEIADFILLSFREKYNVMVATNGAEALQKLSEKSPDLVICDIIMPEMDGIEFTKKFKANPKTSHIPLILLTGQSETKKQMEGLKSGADAYIVKPFEIELLEVRIENFLKRREQLLEFLNIDKITKPTNVELVSNDEKILKQVVVCIENHISDPDLDISKLCKETGFSHPSLYRKIKSLTGQTTKEFIRTVRLRRAEQLLKTKKFTISEIMDQTGFTNHSYFSKCFRKVYNLSPKDYIEKKQFL